MTVGPCMNGAEISEDRNVGTEVMSDGDAGDDGHETSSAME